MCLFVRTLTPTSPPSKQRLLGSSKLHSSLATCAAIWQLLTLEHDSAPRLQHAEASVSFEAAFSKNNQSALVSLNCLHEYACTTVEDIFWNVLCCASSVGVDLLSNLG